MRLADDATTRRCLTGLLSALIALAALDAGCQPADTGGLAADLTALIEREREEKGIGALSIAVVDGEEVIWSAGFGEARPGQLATADTIYRVGSVSKLFTDIAIVQQVEQGVLDLDEPVRRYLPDFRPENPYGREVTLRQLMAHRSGLVREPPVGHYFDASSPDLAATVASLNQTRLVYPPESRTKYSNAGIAVVGRVLEQVTGQPFAVAVKQRVLEPMGLASSGFEPDPATSARLADAEMWSYDGRRFPAPTFELGMSPAGSLYASVQDLARFLVVVFRDGAGPKGPVLSPASLAGMLEPQFPGSAYGLGFRQRPFEGRTRHGHGGAIYGFSTELAFLKQDRLGVVVASNLDVTNAVVTRIADRALRLLLARREGRALEPLPSPSPLSPETARRLEGDYHSDGERVSLVERDGRLFAWLGGSRVGLRQLDADTLVTDGRLALGDRLDLVGDDRLSFAGRTWTRAPRVKPAPAPERLRGLVGEYGWDHNVLFVLEEAGRLAALIEWTELDPLEDLGDDVFAFPAEGGLYHGERIAFERDSGGRGVAAIAAGIRFPRRELQGEGADSFSIEPLRPVEELRAEARAASPPATVAPPPDAELVELTALDPSIRLDIRYATTRNFLETRFYEQARAFLVRPAAEALARVQASLAPEGYGLLIHDGYRPWFVTRMFWDATPESMRHFVADPAHGSRHNRGCAVDLTLVDLESGAPVEMVGLYDEFSERSYPDYVGGTALQRWHRERLRDAMEAEGFRVYEYEWWHFDFEGWEKYPLRNQPFEALDGAATPNRP